MVKYKKTTAWFSVGMLVFFPPIYLADVADAADIEPDSGRGLANILSATTSASAAMYNGQTLMVEDQVTGDVHYGHVFADEDEDRRPFLTAVSSLSAFNLD